MRAIYFMSRMNIKYNFNANFCIYLIVEEICLSLSWNQPIPEKTEVNNISFVV